MSSKSNTNFENLLVLDLAHNKLEFIPQNLQKLISLKTLLLNDNFIKEIDYLIMDKLVKLQSFVIRNNLLTFFQVSKPWFKSLNMLDLSYNHIKVIPHEIGELVQLE